MEPRTRTFLKTAFIIALIAVLPLSVFSEPAGRDILSWLASEPLAAPYRNDEPRISALLSEAESRKVPLGILFDKLKEGASKRVPPRTLVKFLEEEKNRLLVIEELVRASNFDPGPDGGKDLFKTCSIALLNGLESDTLRTALKEAGKRGRSREDLTELVSVLLRMKEVHPADSESIAAFVSAVFEGKVPASQYGTFVSLYMKAVAGRSSPGTILRIMTDVMRAGGGTLQIERELTRRTRLP